MGFWWAGSYLIRGGGVEGAGSCARRGFCDAGHVFFLSLMDVGRRCLLGVWG